MNNFGGNARSRPRVNLGGKKKELSKEELLKKASAERHQRELLRRQDAAARVIQRQWSCWKDETTEQGAQLARTFCFFFEPKVDRHRIELLIKNLLPVIWDSREKIRIHHGPYLKCILQYVKRHSLPPKEEYRTLQLLATLISQQPGMAFMKYIDFRVFYQYLSNLVSACAVRKKDDPVLPPLIECIISPLLPPDARSWRQFFFFSSEILTNKDFHKVPALVKTARKALEVDFRFSPDFNGTLVVDQCDNYLGNFISVTVDRMARSALHLRRRWMVKFCITLRDTHSTMLIKYNDTSSNCSKNEGPSSDLDELGSRTGLLDPLVLLSQFSQDQMARTFHPDLIRTMLSDGYSVELANYVCQLLRCYPRCRDQLMMALSLYATSPHVPYNLLKASYQTWITSGEETTRVTYTFSNLLLFHLELLSRVLMTMVDDEFFDPDRNPLGLDMVKDTVSRLKKRALESYTGSNDYYLNANDDDDHIPSKYVQDLCSRVLQQVQIRDARRSFLPKDFWLYTDKFDMRSLVTQVLTEAFPQVADDDDEGEKSTGVRADQVSPRIRLLNDCPFFFPFHIRIHILRALIAQDAQRSGFHDFYVRSARHHVSCQRGREFEDGLEDLWPIGGGIKGPLSVGYQDIHGMPEAGIDGGGLTKEFLTAACKQAFHPEFGLFVETPERLLYPNPVALKTPERSSMYFEFLGRIIAKCIYDGILVDVAFAPFFLLKWVGKLSYLDDLQAMDRELYNGLLKLKNYTGDVENDLALDFTVNEDVRGKQITVSLIPSGADTPVTRVNRLQYIHLVCNFKLNSRVAKQSQAFVKGMSEVLDLRWLGMFNQNEMQALVGGAPVPIDLDDLRKNTVYGGFSEDDDTVHIFWDVLNEFSNEERRSLIKFVTSTPRPPLLGFGELQPKFSLRWAGNDINRLPTASTCVNLLKLPGYQTHEQMRTKLRLSISADAGFDLS